MNQEVKTINGYSVKDETARNNKLEHYIVTPNITSRDLQKLIDINRYKIIEFTKGIYTFSERIYLKSNTEFQLNGSTINSEFTDTYGDNLLFLGYSLDSEYTKYNGVSNVKFINGKINTSFAFMHNTNIEFNNIEFDNITSHAMQIGGCKNIKILNCIFNGTIIKPNDDGQNHELIQLERATYQGQPYLPENSISYDETGNFNILIDNCIFKEGNEETTRNYVCIGHHSYSEDYPYYNENITISNCIFNKSIYSDISGGSFNNLKVFNNDFKSYGEDDSNVHCRLRFYNKNVYIYNNNFTGRTGIQNVNIHQQENIHIFENTFNLSQSGIAISMNSTNGCYIHDNFIKNNGYHIYIANQNEDITDNINIYNNYFDMKDINENRYGIALYNGTGIKIENNYVEQNNNRYFIWINGAEDYFIKGNKIITNQLTPYYINGISYNYNKIYNIYRSLFAGSGTDSHTITNQSVDFAFNTFNKLELLLHKVSNAAVMKRVILEPYSINGKFDKRDYPITMLIDGVIETAIFSINQDGTFSFTSSNNKIVLRNLNGYNE